MAYEKLSGSARRYVDTSTGETISRREHLKRTQNTSFEKIREANIAKDIRSGFTPTNRQSRYNKVVSDYKKSEAERLGIKPKDVKVRGNNESSNQLKQIVKDLKSKDVSAEGKKAKALVTLGRRKEEWSYAVGESPSKE